MKRIIAGMILASASTFALANPAGCGFGSTAVFPDANQWHQHVMAATTNASSGNQTFGMTSGTSGCEDANGPLKSAQVFMDDNMDQLAADAATGQGETLAALAEVMGVNAEDRTAFNRVMQANFDAVFNAEATSASSFAALTAAMAKDENLQKYLG